MKKIEAPEKVVIAVHVPSSSVKILVNDECVLELANVIDLSMVTVDGETELVGHPEPGSIDDVSTEFDPPTEH